MRSNKKNSCPKGYVMRRGVCSPVNNKYNAISSNNTGGNNVMDAGYDCCSTGCSNFYAKVICGIQTVICNIPTGCYVTPYSEQYFLDFIHWEYWDEPTTYAYGQEMLVPDYSFEGVNAGDMPYTTQCYNGCEHAGGDIVSACLGIGQLEGGNYGGHAGQMCNQIVHCNCMCYHSL